MEPKSSALNVMRKPPEILSFLGRNKFYQEAVLAKCFCGTEFVTTERNIKTGNTRSCGCLQRAAARAIGAKNRIHGHRTARTPEYWCWSHMIQRCYNPNNCNYHNYGSRGITICREWRNSFASFLAYLESTIGLRPSDKHSLDRINNDGNYEPGNIRWATRSQQERNKRKKR